MRRTFLLLPLALLGLALPTTASAVCTPTPQPIASSGNPDNHAPKVELVYARPSDVTNRFTTVHDQLRDAATAMRSAIITRSGATQDIRFDLFQGIECAGSPTDWTPGVASVALPHSRAYYSFLPGQLTADLRALLPSGSRDDVLAFVDGTTVTTAGDGPVDDTPGAINAANAGARVAVVAGAATPGWSGKSAGQTATLGLASLLRTLGVSRTPCPASDVLCVSGSTVGSLDTLGVDGAGTSYYAPGSSLGGHFDLADSTLLCRVSRCADTTPATPSGGLSLSAPAVVGQPVRVSWNGAGGDGPFTYLWDVDGTGYARGAGAPNGDSVVITPQTTAAKAIKVRVANADGQWVESALTLHPAATPPAQTTSTPATSTSTTTAKPTTTTTATTTAKGVANVVAKAPSAVAKIVAPIVRPAFSHELDKHTMSVDASLSELPDNALVGDYTWDFGDGATGTGEHALHVYAEDGKFSVTLSFTLLGQRYSKTVLITVGTGKTTGCATSSASTKSPLKVGTTPRRQPLASVRTGLIITGVTRHMPSTAPLKLAVFSGRKQLAKRSVSCSLADGGAFTVRVPVPAATKAGTTLTVSVLNPRLHAGTGVRVKVS